MNGTNSLVETLKQEGQDYEWYPTTDFMIEEVMKHLPKDAASIMDIGAGDGRVLEQLKTKCEYAALYSIEKSSVLVQAQSKDIIPLGTDLFEQNLSTLPVDFIFCNPVYSEYEEWVCKIILQGYAIRAYLIIPQRWNKSKLIKDALEKRGATARGIHFDTFLNGDRASRAEIEIVEITYPDKGYGNYHRGVTQNTKDPFDIWFDQHVDTFDKAEEFKESETSEELARRYKHSTIPEMVEAYRAEYDLMEQNYREIFKLDYALLKELSIDKKNVREGLKKRMSGLKIKYWDILFKRLDAITSRLSTRSKDNLLKKLTANNIIDFTAGNAYAVVLWAIKNANQYFEDQAVELFYDLSTFEGVLNYKSNQKTWQKNGWRYNNDREFTHYSLDYRIVVSRYTAIQKDSYRTWEHPGHLHRDCHDLLADVIAVFNNLGFSTESDSSYSREWEGGKWQDWYDSSGEWGKGLDILFQAKAYLNGNIHFRFMPSAIKALNVYVARILKWVSSVDDVVEEMGYTRKEAMQYFNHSPMITVSSLPMLMAPGQEIQEEPITEIIEDVEEVQEIEEDESQDIAVDELAQAIKEISTGTQLPLI